MPNCTRFTWRNGAFESVVVLILQYESTYNNLNNSELWPPKIKGFNKNKICTRDKAATAQCKCLLACWPARESEIILL